MGLCKDGWLSCGCRNEIRVIQSQMSLEEYAERPRTAFRATYEGGMKLSRLYNIRILCDSGPRQVVASEDACTRSPWGVIARISVYRPGLVRR